MASGDKCAGTEADMTWCNPGHTSTLPSMNISPLIRKTPPPIQRAKNKIKRGLNNPAACPSLTRACALLQVCNFRLCLKLLLCDFFPLRFVFLIQILFWKSSTRARAFDKAFLVSKLKVWNRWTLQL